MRSLLKNMFEEDVETFCVQQKDALIQFFFDWLDQEAVPGSPLLYHIPDPSRPWDDLGEALDTGETVSGQTTIGSFLASLSDAKVSALYCEDSNYPTRKEELDEFFAEILDEICQVIATGYCEKYRKEIVASYDLKDNEFLADSFISHLEGVMPTDLGLCYLSGFDIFLDSVSDMMLEEAWGKRSGITDIIAQNRKEYWNEYQTIRPKYQQMADTIVLGSTPHLSKADKGQYKEALALLKKTYSDFEIALLVWSRRITASNSVYETLSRPVKDKIKHEEEILGRKYEPRSLAFSLSGTPTIQDLPQEARDEFNDAQAALAAAEQAKKDAARARKEERKKRRQQQKAEENEARAYLSLFDVSNMLEYAQTLSRKFIIHCGPTNSGKTYQALHALSPAVTGCYLGPLRLLALEVFDTLNADGIPCSLLTGEERIDTPYAGVTASTIEMADLRMRYDIAIIDEAQLITDLSRGGHWFSAILRINAAEVHICVAPEGLELVRSLVDRTGSPCEVIQHERLTPLTYGGQFSHKDWRSAQRGDAFIAFSRKAVLSIAAELEFHGHKASVIYGALPPRSRREEVRRFVEGETEVVVATDAIGMGVSLPIRRIIFCETEKFDGRSRRPLTAAEVKQIAGRAGRYGIYNEGYMMSMSDGKSMRKKLSADPEPFEKAVIPFPKEALSSKFPLPLLVALWGEMEPVAGFEFEDLTGPTILLGYLLRIMGEKQIKSMSKTTVFQYISCPLDIKNNILVSYWVRCAVALLRDQEMPMPVISTATLEDCECSYRALDIASQMSHRAGIVCDVSEQKRQVASAIDRFLKKGKARRTCKYCGRPISPIGPFTMCQNCYDAQHRWYDDDLY